jgi:AAA domain, putative AbiEii toxin, Type IV TA system
MQPLAFVFGEHPPPLRRGHLPLADLTVLLGPNDAGKSRTLDALASLLDGRSPARSGAVVTECGPEERCLLRARLGATELDDHGAPLIVVEPDGEGTLRLSSASYEHCYDARDLRSAGVDGRPGWAQPGTPMPGDDAVLTAAALMPRAVVLPSSLEELRVRLEGLIARVVLELTSGRDDTDGWMESSDAGRSARVHPLAAAITRRFGREVTNSLPDFVSRGYELACEVLPLVEWQRSGRTRLMLRSLRDGVFFPAQDAAAGYRVWIQLALWDTLRRLERQLVALRHAGITGEREDLNEVAWDPAAVERLAASLARDPARYEPAVLDDVLGALRPWIFLIDEPEQHMHPALIRRASHWLADRMRAPGAHAVVVTHSADLLAEESGAFLVYVERGAHETSYRPFDFATMRATDRIAAEMGFDRGELLTRVRVVLYVEGAMDRVVIDELFGAQLARRGIALGVFGGVANVKDVLDHPVVRYTSAHVAVLVDAVPLEEARRIRDDAKLRESLLGGEGERSALARVIEAARRRDRVVEPFGIEARDIFMVLDDDAIREIAPQWPGQLEAEEVWLRYREGGGRKGFKRYYKDRWDLPVSIPTCRQVARRMAAAGRRPAELVRLIDELERLGSA